MKRRCLTGLAACAALACLSALPAAAGGAEGPRLTELGGAAFPNRSYALNLPARRVVRARELRVTENGRPVVDLSVVPAASESKRGLVLVVDASNSMRGKPIDAAVAAARAFAAQRSGDEPLAIVSFNSAVTVELPFTTDEAAIEAAVARRPRLAEETHIYDGVASGIALVREEGLDSASIVVLSDGADRGSTETEAQVAEAARGANARIFTVGLSSRFFERGPLQRLAANTGARYLEAQRAGQLVSLYRRLGSEIANEYVVRYRSLAGPKQRVRVLARVDGVPGVARSGYETPALGLATTPPYRGSTGAAIWQSPISMVLIGLLSAMLLTFGVAVLFRPRNETIQTRVGEFVSLGTVGARQVERGTLTTRMFTGAERSLERTRWWERFKEALELAEITIPAVQVVLWTAVGTIFAIWLGSVIAGPLFALLGLGLPLVVRGVVKRKLSRRRNRFAEQLPDNLQVLSSAIRAGHGLVGALSVVVNDAPEPARTEFRRVIADEQLGVPLESSLREVGRRMASREMDQVALVAALGRETGGNTAEVLDRVTDTIRERAELRRLVNTLTAQGRLSRWVVSLLPVALIVAITLLNPDYITPLFHSGIGRVLLFLSTLLVLSGSFAIKRIVDIKV